MSIKVNNFRWEKGKNDLEYIALLEKNLDRMKSKYRECAKVARGQYNKGREDVLDELQSLIDYEYYDGGYGDYHEVSMIAKMIEKLKEQKAGEQNEL